MKLLEKYSLVEGDVGQIPGGELQGEFEALVELGIMDAALFSTAEKGERQNDRVETRKLPDFSHLP